jgi:hypothetical protein
MADESAEVTLNQNQNNRFELVQPFRAETVSTSTNTNTASETLEVKPLSQTLEVKPLSQTLEVKPLAQSQTSNQTLDLRPVRTDASSTLDLKPVAMDVTVRTGQASIPPTHVCEPYHHRLGLTMFGIELFGLAWSGDSQTIVDNRRSHPATVFGDVLPAPTQHVPLPYGHHHEYHHHEHGGHHGGPRGGGLRIRLTG